MYRIGFILRSLYVLSVVAIGLLLAAPAWAAYVIYVQGTNNSIPLGPNVPIDTIFNGSFNAGNTVQNVSYPATVGLLNVLTYTGGYGLLPPTLNKSVAIGVAALDAQIKADQQTDPNAQIYVIGLSQGAVVGTQEALALKKQGPASYANVTFILAGSPNRLAPSGGGILNQIPIRINIPGVLTVGGGVLSTPPPTDGPTIIDVTNQGDPFANFNSAKPLTFLGGLAKMLVNSAGPHNYTTTVLTPAMVTGNNPYPSNYVVTSNGNVTDVFIPRVTSSPAPHQRVPLLQPVKTPNPLTTFQPVSASVQSSASAPTSVPMLTLRKWRGQRGMSTPNSAANRQVANSVASQQLSKPVANQGVAKPARIERHMAAKGTTKAA